MLLLAACGPAQPKPLSAGEKATCERARRTFSDARAIKSDSIADANPEWQKSNELWQNAIAGVTNARLKGQCGVDTAPLFDTWMNFLDRSLDRLERDDTFQVSANDIALAIATAPLETGPQEFFGPDLLARFDRASQASWALRFKQVKKVEDLATKEPLCVFSSQTLAHVNGAQLHNAWADATKETWGRCVFPMPLKEWKHEGPDEVVISWLTWNEAAGKPSLEYVMTVKGVQPIGDRSVMFHFQPKAAFKKLPGIRENRWVGLHVSYKTKEKVDATFASIERASGVVLARRGKK
jgi:hypothetical protein